MNARHPQPYGGGFSFGDINAVAHTEAEMIAMAETAARLGATECASAVGANPPSAPAADVLYAFPTSVEHTPRNLTPVAGSLPEVPAAGVPPYVLNDLGGVPLLEPDYSAPEGHASAAALAAEAAARTLGAALRCLVAAQDATNVGLRVLEAIPADAPARRNVDHIVIDVTRSRNELAGIIETLTNLGVTE